MFFTQPALREMKWMNSICVGYKERLKRVYDATGIKMRRLTEMDWKGMEEGGMITAFFSEDTQDMMLRLP